MLHSFADFAQGRSEEFIQTDSVLEWAASAPSVRQRHDRLLIIRRLACALNAEDKPPSAANASPTTTSRYATLDLDMKRDAINHVKPIAASRKTGRRTSETVLQWLENL